MEHITTGTSLLSADFSNILIAKVENQDVAYFIDYLKKDSTAAQKVIVTRGHKSKSLTALFDEWAAALQFPVYFGENLAAFVDCLRNFSRCNFTSLMIVVTHSSELLQEDKECLADFYAILTHLPHDWQQIDPKQQPMTFRLILQEDAKKIDIPETILNRLKVDYTKIAGDWFALLSTR